MKIKILSMQRIKNHGSFLQSYGLKKILESLGAEVGFYDIAIGENNDEIVVTRQSEQKYNRRTDKIFHRLFMRLCTKKQDYLFKLQLKKYLMLTDEITTNDVCDLAVIGSDEVFNCVSPAKWGFSAQLFGDIPNAEKTITYAASCGRTTYKMLNKYFENKIKNAFENIVGFSVRDENTSRFVEKISGKKPEIHLDPVLVSNFDAEVQICRFKEPFLLLYSYANRITNPEEINAIKQYAKRKKLKIVCAGVFQYWCNHNIPVTSFELLGFFDKADCVITDTFHGTILAVKAHKLFVTIIRDSNQNKLTYLLKTLGLADRQLNHISELQECMEKDINYSMVDKILETEKEKTLLYLKQYVE